MDVMKNKTRRQQLSYVADKLGMSFSATDDYGFLELLADFQLFKKGRYKAISNILRKEDEFGEFDVRIFDYQFKKGRGRSNIHRQTVFFVQSKKLSLPQILMKPENLFHKIGALLGMQDIDFEEFPDFSNNYLLQGEDEELIRDVMDEKVLKFFSIEKGWYLEGIGYYLVVYKKYKLLGPRQLVKFYNKGLEIHQMLLNDWQLGKE